MGRSGTAALAFGLCLFGTAAGFQGVSEGVSAARSGPVQRMMSATALHRVAAAPKARRHSNVVGFDGAGEVQNGGGGGHLGDVQFQLTGVDKQETTWVNVIKPESCAGLKPMARHKRRGETVFVSTLHLNEAAENSDIVYTYVIGKRTISREEEGERLISLPPNAGQSAVVTKGSWGSPADQEMHKYGEGAEELWIQHGDADSEPMSAVVSEMGGQSDPLMNEGTVLEEMAGAARSHHSVNVAAMENLVFREDEAGGGNPELVMLETEPQVIRSPFNNAMKLPAGIHGVSRWLRRRRFLAAIPRVDGPSRGVASLVRKTVGGVFHVTVATPVSLAAKGVVGVSSLALRGINALRGNPTLLAACVCVPAGAMMPQVAPRVAGRLAQAIPPSALHDALVSMSADSGSSPQGGEIPKRGGMTAKSSGGNHAVGRSCPNCNCKGSNV